VTAADHANTVREALTWRIQYKGAKEDALAALDALQAQAEESSAFEQAEKDANERATAAEAERDAAVQAAEHEASESKKWFAIAQENEDRAEAAEQAAEQARNALQEARDWIADDMMPGNDWQARVLNRIDAALAGNQT
jgi:hypothetical protein